MLDGVSFRRGQLGVACDVCPMTVRRRRAYCANNLVFGESAQLQERQFPVLARRKPLKMGISWGRCVGCHTYAASRAPAYGLLLRPQFPLPCRSDRQGRLSRLHNKRPDRETRFGLRRGSEYSSPSDDATRFCENFGCRNELRCPIFHFGQSSLNFPIPFGLHFGIGFGLQRHEQVFRESLALAGGEGTGFLRQFSQQFRHGDTPQGKGNVL